MVSLGKKKATRSSSATGLSTMVRATTCIGCGWHPPLLWARSSSQCSLLLRDPCAAPTCHLSRMITPVLSFSYNEEGSKIVLVIHIPVNTSPLKTAADLKINLKSIF